MKRDMRYITGTITVAAVERKRTSVTSKVTPIVLRREVNLLKKHLLIVKSLKAILFHTKVSHIHYTSALSSLPPPLQPEQLPLSTIRQQLTMKHVCFFGRGVKFYMGIQLSPPVATDGAPIGLYLV
uniref:Uncharacterized protein n=1 Tax=Onchocerca volvulus TaxID=6282 RepID=A0A8R1XLB7_ONCVO